MNLIIAFCYLMNKISGFFTVYTSTHCCDIANAHLQWQLHTLGNTVEPRLSEPRSSEPSIIRTIDSAKFNDIHTC